ncbi:hypothetical protein, unlikely [Trypanosoma brucei gambiense DAL972]|uniref:T. brucei spp.-specific protein n=1 Tax=Trypanosoma brucei gambiense (strain MHOM/CI/86/DAL972) TaxID=679716 RepID=C9ZV32_TRYB9|nr:hypothetical protein, unlikely [Trypanosoma brucei gambiense DAL972]CBH13270.1 hypothetical protein, unlikely [Trypanosoma brucei gambiense DAL972]|eukprot:XP_011775547.1 hypothetical protein, unlikely [Trypanosoma brucei gambiense DAL972]
MAFFVLFCLVVPVYSLPLKRLYLTRNMWHRADFRFISEATPSLRTSCLTTTARPVIIAPSMLCVFFFFSTAACVCVCVRLRRCPCWKLVLVCNRALLTPSPDTKGRKFVLLFNQPLSRANLNLHPPTSGPFMWTTAAAWALAANM